MLTLAFAQIIYAVAFQWVEVTGGDNGVVGVWPSRWAAEPDGLLLPGAAADARRRRCCCGAASMRPSATRCARRAIRRSRRRHRHRRPPHRWLAFTLAGAAAGLAGGLFAFSKGSIDPTLISIPMSVDFLVDDAARRRPDASSGRWSGAGAVPFACSDLLMPLTDLWRLLLGPRDHRHRAGRSRAASSAHDAIGADARAAAAARGPRHEPAGGRGSQQVLRRRGGGAGRHLRGSRPASCSPSSARTARANRRSST